MTKIDIPASKAGSYQMTCQMGMMSGTLQVGGAGAGGGSALPAVALGAAALSGLVYYSRRRKAQAEAEAARGAHRKGGTSQGGKAGHGSAVPQPATAPTYFGFTQSEALITLAALAAAIVTGLAMGGLFR